MCSANVPGIHIKDFKSLPDGGAKRSRNSCRIIILHIRFSIIFKRVCQCSRMPQDVMMLDTEKVIIYSHLLLTLKRSWGHFVPFQFLFSYHVSSAGWIFFKSPIGYSYLDGFIILMSVSRISLRWLSYTKACTFDPKDINFPMKTIIIVISAVA